MSQHPKVDLKHHEIRLIKGITMQVERRVEELKSRRLIIELPESFVNHKIEVIILTIDEGEAPRQPHKRRKPPPQFAGKVKELGNVMSSVPSSDWGITE